MGDYVFPVTEALINNGVLGKGGAAEADAYLAQLDSDSIIRPRVMAAMTEFSETQAQLILREYEARGLLKADEMIECETCRTLNSAEEVEEARSDGDDYECDGGCGRDIALQGSGAVVVFRLLDTPA